MKWIDFSSFPVICCIYSLQHFVSKRWRFFVLSWRWEQSQQHLLDYQDLVTLCLHVLLTFQEIELSDCGLDQERSLMTYWVQWIRFQIYLFIFNNDWRKLLSTWLSFSFYTVGCWRCIHSWGSYCIGWEVPCKNASSNCSCSHYWQWIDSQKSCSWVDELTTG